ncbi:MAG TPA: UbiA family prenyltransferase [candidate division Zixibacteria bacterium]|nr:UbiA family prenyltransferase [candidate division Zixibacteria bacterium]
MKIVDYIFAARPLLLLPVWSIYLVTRYYLADSAKYGLEVTDISMLAALTFMAAGSYYINQIADLESDILNNKLGFLQKDLVTRRGLIRGFFALSALSMIIVVVRFSAWDLLIVEQLFILGVVYSLRPFRAKDRPIGGFLVNAYGYGFLIPLTVHYWMFHIKYVHVTDLRLPAYFFCTVGAIYLLTTISDRPGDLKTGKRTAGVLLPQPLVLLFALILLSLSAWLAYNGGFDYLLYISIAACGPVIGAFFVKSEIAVLIATKLPILLLTIQAGYYYHEYLWFIVAVVISTRLYYKYRFGITYPRLT